jgi:hypothetical protein
VMCTVLLAASVAVLNCVAQHTDAALVVA